MNALVRTALDRGTAVLALDYQHGVHVIGWKHCCMAALSSRHHECSRGAGWSGSRCFIGKVFVPPQRIKFWRVFAPDRPPFYGAYVPVVTNRAVLSYERDNPSPLKPRNNDKVHSVSESAIRFARRYYVPDGSHPSEHGHVLISRLVLHALVRAHDHLAAHGCPPGDETGARASQHAPTPAAVEAYAIDQSISRASEAGTLSSGAAGQQVPPVVTTDVGGVSATGRGGAFVTEARLSAPSPVGTSSSMVARTPAASMASSLASASTASMAKDISRVPSAPSSFASAMCILGNSLHDLIGASQLESSGWSWVVETSRLGMPKPGFVAHRPNATLLLR